MARVVLVARSAAPTGPLDDTYLPARGYSPSRRVVAALADCSGAGVAAKRDAVRSCSMAERAGGEDLP
jgi:hypothetical protein